MKEFNRKNRLEPFRALNAFRRVFPSKPFGHRHFGRRIRRNALIIFILPASFLLFGNQIGWCRMYDINRS